MPSVASEPKAHSVTPHASQTPRPQPPSERAPPSPFESLLDDGAQSAAPPAPPPKPEKSERAEPNRPNTPSEADRPAKRADSSDTARTDAPDKTEKTDKPETGAETAARDTAGTPDDLGAKAEKAVVDVNGAQEQAAGDDTNVDKAGDGKKSKAGDDNGNATPDAQSLAVATPTPDKPAVSATAAAPVPVPADGAATSGSDEQPSPVTTPITLAPADTALKKLARLAIKTDADTAAKAKDKPSPSASQKTDASETAATTDNPANTAPAAQADANPNIADDKQAAVQFHDEVKRVKEPASKPDAPQTAAPANTSSTKPATDVVQTLTLNAPAQANAASNSNAAATTPPAQTLAVPVPLAGVPVAIATKALEGKNRFDIRLDPPELGRIDVRLDVDKDGKVTSQLVAHRADTLDLLRRDAAGLQRALQDAGLKTADNGLQFSLHDQSANRQQDDTGGRSAQLLIQDETLDPIETASSPYARLVQLRGGLDIRV